MPDDVLVPLMVLGMVEAKDYAPVPVEVCTCGAGCVAPAVTVRLVCLAQGMSPKALCAGMLQDMRVHRHARPRREHMCVPGLSMPCADWSIGQACTSFATRAPKTCLQPACARAYTCRRAHLCSHTHTRNRM